MEFQNIIISDFFIKENIFNGIPLFVLSSVDNGVIQKNANFSQITFSENIQNYSFNNNPIFLFSSSSNWIITMDKILVLNNTGSKIILKISNLLCKVTDFLDVSNNYHNFSFSNTIFHENKLNDNILVKNSNNANFLNISCLKNNNKSALQINGGGTCFVFRAVSFVSFNLVTISDSFNDHTTVGVKLIQSQVSL